MKYIKQHCVENLEAISTLLTKLDSVPYTHPLANLSMSTLGQHVRHVLEFYQCLIKGKATGVINYDNRARNLQIETSTQVALETIQQIQEDFKQLEEGDIAMEGNYTSEKDEIVSIKSSMERELAFCLEHSIHHQALLKVGLIELGLQNHIDQNFGVAPATIRFKEVYS